MCERAFHLQYRNVENDHIAAWWNVVDRADVTRRSTTERTATQVLIVT